MPDAADKEPKPAEKPLPIYVMPKMICYVCGSENLSTEKCKVWCRDCHALIENCSGD